ncbi:hypothetical protein [Citrobacter freundii]|uniref:hypothetical protein n=1 Tax=Citrobacter freundii TaxID=546 RepID=UPI0008FD86EC|nr:hypothetical protein [Citrobacter freundii]OIY14133.1 hypothetical protein BED45_24840 [Citrobacter freundii]
MIKRTGMVVVAVLLSGCLPKPQPAHLYQEPSAGENTAKLRVRGFTDSTTVYRVDSCEQAFFLGSLRDPDHPERNPSRASDRGYKKADVPEDNAPLDYMEVTLPAGHYIQLRPAIFTTDHQICSVMTPWFKPEKGVLYEVRSQLTPDGRQCYVRTWKVDQQNGAVTPVTGPQSIRDVMTCAKYPVWQ